VYGYTQYNTSMVKPIFVIIIIGIDTTCMIGGVHYMPGQIARLWNKWRMDSEADGTKCIVL